MKQIGEVWEHRHKCGHTTQTITKHPPSAADCHKLERVELRARTTECVGCRSSKETARSLKDKMSV